MTVSAPGFSTLQQGEVNVIIGRATRVDFTLKVGQRSGRQLHRP